MKLTSDEYNRYIAARKSLRLSRRKFRPAPRYGPVSAYDPHAYRLYLWQKRTSSKNLGPEVLDLHSDDGLLYRRHISDRVSYVTPGFFTLQRFRHPLPQHYYRCFRQKETSSLGQVVNHTVDPIFLFDDVGHILKQIGVTDKVETTFNRSYWSYAGYPVDWDTPTAWPSHLLAQATDKLLHKLSAREASIGEFVGEFKQCVDMFHSTSRRICDSLFLLGTSGPRAALRALGLNSVRAKSPWDKTYTDKKHLRYLSYESFADRWLELQYGWLPLLSDLHGLVKTLALHTDNSQIISRQVVHVKEIVPSFQSSEDHQSITTAVGLTDYDVGFTVRYRVANPDSHLANQLQLNDPLSIAWNLLPYSFVFDWFVDIGGFLENYNATSGLGFVDGAKTLKVIHSCDCMCNRWSSLSGLQTGTYQTASFTASCIGRFKLREGLIDFPSPNLERGAGLTMSRLANANALLIQKHASISSLLSKIPLRR